MKTLNPLYVALLVALTASCGLGDDDEKQSANNTGDAEISISTSVSGESAPQAVELEEIEHVAVKEDGSGGGAILGGVEETTEKAKEGAENLVEKTKEAAADVAGGAKEMVEDAAEGTKELAADAVEGTKELAADAVEGTKELAADAVEGTKEIVDNAGEAVSEGADKVKTAAAAAGAAVVAAGAAAKDKATEMVQGNNDVSVKEAEVNTAPIEEASVTGGNNGQIEAADALVQQLEEALEAAKKARASLD